MSGTLVLVATPIGNLADMSPRALQVLREATLLCCEDTRRTGLLLHRLGVPAPPLAVANDHTEHDLVPRVLDVLAHGGTVAVVSDAGTPGISDPGERLVRAAVAAGHTVTTVPGPSALAAALVVSGLPTDRVVFEGFVPRAGRDRATRLTDIADERRTVVLYEAPHRLARTLADLVAHCGPERRVVICRELTKLHEEVWRGTLGEALARTEAHEPRGEHVLVLAGAPAPPPPDADDVDAALLAALARGESTRDAASEVAAALGLGRRAVYARAIELARTSG